MQIYRNENNNLHRDNDLPAVVGPDVQHYCVNGRLHRSNGPASVTPNGELFYWKGVHIEPSLWHSRETMSAEEILNHPNTEVRRCLLEMVGYEKLLAKTPHQVLDEDPETGAVLYKVDVPDDEALVVVKVIDGTELKDENGKGYRKVYFLKVPPTSQNCEEAIAWTFDMTVEEYKRLEVET